MESLKENYTECSSSLQQLSIEHTTEIQNLSSRVEALESKYDSRQVSCVWQFHICREESFVDMFSNLITF